MKDRVSPGIRRPHSIKCQRPPRRADERVEGRALSCPWGGKLLLKAEEPPDGQWHRMEKAMGNHSIKDPNGYPKYQQLMMEGSLVKFSGDKIIPHSDLRVGTTKETYKPKGICVRRMATWNVNFLLQCGKLENVKIEMKRMNIDILRVSEMGWPNHGDFWTGDYRVIHSGTAQDKPGIAGVGIILSKHLGMRVKGYFQHSERIILVRLETKPRDTIVIQVYMPTTSHEEDEIDMMYDHLEEIIGRIKGDENLVILGDMNAVVGEGKEEEVAGEFGLGLRNERGDKLVEFCQRNKLGITNTFFNHHPRRRYTWKMPVDINRYQIDFILVKQRFKNQVKDSRSYPGCDVGCDHVLVMMTSELKFKRIKKRNRCKWDLVKLKNKNTLELYQQATDKKTNTRGCNDIQESWRIIKNGTLEAAGEIIGKVREKEGMDY